MNRERRNRAESLLRSEDMASVINQVVFFMLCDRWFYPQDKLTGLYALISYNIIYYQLMFTQRLMYLSDITPIIIFSKQSKVRYFTIIATKMVLEFVPAITYFVTGVFMFLGQGLKLVNPTCYYIGITALYFTVTERTCQEKIMSLLTYLNCDFFESLENLWTPVLVRLCSFLASCFMILLVFLHSHENLILLSAACFINVFMTAIDLHQHWKALKKEKSRIEIFRFATLQEITDNDDVCAICLQSMSTARVTPCLHMFHEICLRRCLRERPTCPMCKHYLQYLSDTLYDW